MRYELTLVTLVELTWTYINKFISSNSDMFSQFWLLFSELQLKFHNFSFVFQLQVYISLFWLFSQFWPFLQLQVYISQIWLFLAILNFSRNCDFFLRIVWNNLVILTFSCNYVIFYLAILSFFSELHDIYTCKSDFFLQFWFFLRLQVYISQFWLFSCSSDVFFSELCDINS